METPELIYLVKDCIPVAYVAVDITDTEVTLVDARNAENSKPEVHKIDNVEQLTEEQYVQRHILPAILRLSFKDIMEILSQHIAENIEDFSALPDDTE